jgi:hypothetical protein
MAKRPTKRKPNKFEPSLKEVVQVTQAASLLVGVWTKQETTRLLKAKPIIIPTSWGFRVGKFSIRQEKFSWRVTDDWNEPIGSFTSKKSAIYWCILQAAGRLNQSQTLFEQDFRLGKYSQDQANYTYRRQKAIIANDYFKVDVCDARIAKNESLLEDAKNDLEKTLLSAKYLKGIWEKPL